MGRAKVQLMKCGKGLAVRIPQNILEQASLHDGEEPEVRVENGHIWLQPLSTAASLEALVERVTPENRHGAQDWGKPAGQEGW